jgi:L-alanine-DL-glutamate epimerase-like enolase superfamily enzyme
MPLVELSDRAARCGFEGALLDAWARICGQPLWRFIFGADSSVAATHKPLYYTVSLNDNDAELLASARLGAQTTCFLKIKADADLAKTLRVVPLVLAEARRVRAPRDDVRCVVDANASWSPDTATRFLDWFVANRASVPLVALEQPFPLGHSLGDAELAQWRDVRRLALEAGVDVVADESCSTVDDVPHMVPLCNAVNIKLEKCGGILGALELAASARAYGLKVWLGTMVGSTLNSNTVAQLLPLSDLGGDLDGTLLVRPESDWFTAGFQYGADGCAEWPAAADIGGVGVIVSKTLASER